MSGPGRRDILAGLAACAATPLWAQDAVLPRRPPARPLPDARRSIAQAGLPGLVGHALIDADNGDMLDGGDALAPMPPASTMKALTALYALARLGPARRFRTRLLMAGDLLVLAGGGDPVLSSDGLALLAQDLVAAGLAAPPRFAVWGGALPRLAEIAPEQADHLAYNPAISGMILNFNRVHLGWRRADAQTRLSLEARAAASSPRAYTITAETVDQSQHFAYRDEGRRERWLVSTRTVAAPGSLWLPVRKPELYAGDVFQTLCRAKGLVLPAPEVIGSLPDDGVEIAALESPPLADLLRDMLYFSTNLTAEVVGLSASGAASLETSGVAMLGWLRDQGLGDGFRLADHSGLSSGSLVTAEGLARAMVRARGAPELALLLKPDPLSDTLSGSVDPAIDMAGKTGTLNFVSNLAGRLGVAGGRRAGFAILCADPSRHFATRGQDMPGEAQTWTRDARRLQSRLLSGWAARYLQNPVAHLGR